MSLFIGSDNTGREIIHITGGSTAYSESILKGPPIQDTVLHNDLTFLVYDLVPVTISSHVFSQDKYSSAVYYYHAVQASNTSIMSTSEIAYFLDEYFNVVTPFNGYLSYIPGRYGYSFPVSSSQTSTHHIPIAGKYNKYPPIPYVAYAVTINPRKLITTEGCTISGTGVEPSKFTVGGFDLGSIKYVSRGQVTKHPGSPVIDGFHQLVDATTMGGSIEIEAKIHEGIVIKKGGWVLFDARNSFFMKDSIISTYRVPVSTNSKVLAFVAKLNDVHKVVSYAGTIFVTIGGTNVRRLMATYTNTFWDGRMWLPVTTGFYYVVENTNVYVQAVTTHSYASYMSVPSPFTITVEAFS